MGSSTSTSYGATVFGTMDCGQFVREHSDLQQGWVLGYLSGLNAGLARHGLDPLNQVNSHAQLLIWIDNYCHKNSLSMLVDATTQLYAELVAKAKAGGPK